MVFFAAKMALKYNDTLLLFIINMERNEESSIIILYVV